MHTTLAEAEELVPHLQRFSGTAIVVGLIVEINGKLLGWGQTDYMILLYKSYRVPSVAIAYLVSSCQCT